MKKIFSLKTAIFIIGFLFPINAYCADMYLQPCGQAVGVKMYTDGLIVIDICSVADISGKQAYCKELRKGDIILSAEGQKLSSASELKNIVSNNPKNITLEVKRNNETINISTTPIVTSEGATLGLWLRDSTAGVGTLTYYNPSTGDFGALGHGICDIDTLTLMPLQNGSITDCDVDNVIKSSNGFVGELECSFYNNNIGTILDNNDYGIFGKSDIELSGLPLIKVAKSDEIKTGKAKIYAEVDAGGIKEFEINIKKLNRNNDNGRDMVIEITDPDLLKRTGGIVQGLSGSPIVQNDLFVGAITHVFINNPTRGYGIFIENMLPQTD